MMIFIFTTTDSTRKLNQHRIERYGAFLYPFLTDPKSRNYGAIEEATLEKKAKWNEEETHGT